LRVSWLRCGRSTIDFLQAPVTLDKHIRKAFQRRSNGNTQLEVVGLLVLLWWKHSDPIVF
jgi:hypothetical protein